MVSKAIKGMSTTLFVDDLEGLSTFQCEQLQCGDLVVLSNDEEKFNFVVASKQFRDYLILVHVDGDYIVSCEYDFNVDKWEYAGRKATPILTEEQVKQITSVPVIDLNDADDVKNKLPKALAVGCLIDYDNDLAWQLLSNDGGDAIFTHLDLTGYARLLFRNEDNEWSYIESDNVSYTMLYKHAIQLKDTAQNECIINLISNQQSSYGSLESIGDLSSITLAQNSYLNDGDYKVILILSSTDFLIYNNLNDTIEVLSTSTYPMTFVKDTVSRL